MTDDTTADPAAAADTAEKQPDATTAQETPAPKWAEEAMTALAAERDRFKDAALRALADLDNFRKRSRRDVDEQVKKAREDLLRDLLPVFDNLERAMQYTSGASDAKAIATGIEMVVRLFEDTLGRLGGKRLKTVGLPFDPTQHEAIQQVESTEFPAGTVAREELPGYSLNDRLLRPAMVVVSKGPPERAVDN